MFVLHQPFKKSLLTCLLTAPGVGGSDITITYMMLLGETAKREKKSHFNFKKKILKFLLTSDTFNVLR